MTGTGHDEKFGPYLPAVVIDWLRRGLDASHRMTEGSLAFVDISGFTRLTERFARAGKVGAEEVRQILDAVFSSLMDVAYGYGADLIKWGGDAVLLFFQGDGHASAACAASWEMRRALRRVGKVAGTAGSATLRMSVGIHSGPVMLFLVGSRHRELVITGPAATQTALMEAAAGAGQVAISSATAALLGPAVVSPAKGPGYLLRAAPRVPLRPAGRVPDVTGLDLERCLPPPVAANLLAGGHEGEHRRVAVAFVEFSGTDGLLAADGADAVAVALHHVIATAQDTADADDVTFLGTDISADGGKIILVAGAPRRTGHDETHLLQAARALLAQTGPLTLRAGAHAGRVFAGDLGPAYRRTYSVWGDAVNLAARLMGRAAPGQLLATADILDRSAKTFAFSSLPPLRVKGKAQPVHAFDVGAPLLDQPVPVQARGRLAGREAEVVSLREALGSLRRGRGRIIELTGEPGIGKSRLLAELLALADRERQVVVRCDPYATATPYAAAGLLLRDLLGVPAAAEPSAAADALAAAVAAQAPSLEKWLPLLATAVGAELPETPEVAELADAFRRPRREQAVTDLVGAILRDPAVLAVDDVQFADEASVSIVSRLLEEVPGRPWLVVLTGRVRTPLHAPEAAGLLRLDLGPLPPAAAETLLHEATGGSPLAPHHLAAIVDRGIGNPLFLRELAAEAGHGGDTLPESVEDLIGAQIDRLAPADKSTLRAAAVVGMSFEEGLLAEVLGGPTEAGLWQRLRAFVAVETPGTFRFQHELVRDAAYEGLPYARRRQLHGQLAEALERRAGDAPQAEAAQLSLHYFRARRYPAASYYARIAGERAAAVYANPEAARFLEMALEAARSEPGPAAAEVSRLAEALGDIRYRLGEFRAADRAFAEARKSADGDPVGYARLCEKTALVVARTSGVSPALRWTARGREALAGLADADADRQDALLLAARTLLRYRQGRYAEAAATAAEAIAVARHCGARDVLARALYLLDIVDQARGRYGGEPWAEQALAIFRELANLSWQAQALNALGGRAYFEGRWDDALGYYRQAGEAFERVGDQWNAAITACNAGEILSNQGRYAEAEDATRPAERVLRASGSPPEIAFAATVLGTTAARRGQPDRALRLLEAARADYLKAGEPAAVVATEISIAEALLYAGEADEALARADNIAASQPARQGDATASALARVRGYALALLGRNVSAQQTVDASLRAARERGDRYDEALATDALIRLAEVRGQQAEPGLVARRDELFRGLGVLAVSAPWPGAAQ
jgi:class 3 adenylate cyclase/tetratricopeptide (TPR) repeat protein